MYVHTEEGGLDTINWQGNVSVAKQKNPIENL